jgi:hypothetical protein
MTWGIKAIALTGSSHSDANVNGEWLEGFDVDAFDGRGDAHFTSDPAKAMRFDNAIACFAAWKTQSTVRPLREDGKPNRPLTAFTVTFERLPT